MNTINEALLKSISAFMTGASVRLELTDEQWRELTDRAEEQKLLPMLLESAGAAMPARLQSAVRARVRVQVASQVIRTEQFKKTYAALLEAGFCPIVVKGVLCRQTYAKPDLRISADEDVYVPQDYAAFHAKMLELGFSANEPDYKNAHEERLYRDGLLIEGHWELFPRENGVLSPLNALSAGFLQRTRRCDIGGVSVLTLEPTDHLIFLLLHAFKHFIASGVGIRQMCDVARWMCSYDIDWQRVRSAMEKANAECFAAAVFDACQKYFGASFPPCFERYDSSALLADALDGGIYGTSDMERKHSASITLGAAEGAGGGLIKAIFPGRAVMEMSYPWVGKSALLLPAAWCARIVRYAARHDSSASESIRIGSERTELLKRYRVIRTEEKA